MVVHTNPATEDTMFKFKKITIASRCSGGHVSPLFAEQNSRLWTACTCGRTAFLSGFWFAS